MTDLSALTEAEYHRHPALSASGAKVLAAPAGAAKYRWMMDNPAETKREYDIGHAWHSVVLGVGAQPVEVEGNRNANAVKARIEEVRKAGGVPLRPDDFATVHSMAGQLKKHPIWTLLNHPDRVCEQELWWADRTRRAKLDCRINHLIIDLKSGTDASYKGFQRNAARFGYHIQSEFYKTAVREALGIQRPEFLLVIQEITPPYLVAVYRFDREAQEEGRRAIALAEHRYRQGNATGEWPGYPETVQELSLPAFHDFTTEVDDEH